VIAVLPTHIRQGIGDRLLREVESWMFRTCPEIWLTTDFDTTLRAYSFYRRRGWEDWKIENRNRYMKKRQIQPFPIETMESGIRESTRRASSSRG
jgi:ribosomal protein S18 acetylase RimI-like enzyme